MVRMSSAADARTYLPEDSHGAEIIDFVAALERAGRQAPSQRPAIVGSDGQRTEIPESLLDVLKQVADALVSGMGVNVAPLNAMLTTQEAADYLGISRPTFVRILDRGELPMKRPGRHRYVRLADLIAYQEGVRHRRRDAIDEMVRSESRQDSMTRRMASPRPCADRWPSRSYSTPASCTQRPCATYSLLAALDRCGVPRFVAEVRRKVDLSSCLST